jgi:uncharacterized protein YjiS (DUF1127 family)
MTFERRVLRTVWAGASRVAAWPFRVAATRATLRALGQMDRRELADIGLGPSDLRDAWALPLDRDPGELLARRAGERRANAFTAPPTAWDGDAKDEHPHGDRRPTRPSPGSRSGSPRGRALRTG